MSWWDELKMIARRGAGAVKARGTKAVEALDDALARKERERDATPAERVEMILDEIEDEDARFDEIERRVRESSAAEPSEAEPNPEEQRPVSPGDEAASP